MYGCIQFTHASILVHRVGLLVLTAGRETEGKRTALAASHSPAEYFHGGYKKDKECVGMFVEAGVKTGMLIRVFCYEETDSGGCLGQTGGHA